MAGAVGAPQGSGSQTCRLPSLRQLCLHRLGSELLLSGPAQGPAGAGGDGILGAVGHLPVELQQDLLFLLARWQLATPAALSSLHLADLLPSLTLLDLSGCGLLHGRPLAHACAVAGPLPQLADLNLRSVRLEDGHAATVLGQCPGLTSLTLAKCTLVGSATAAALGSLPSLASLDLSGCPGLAELPPLATLTRLSLACCYRLASPAVHQASLLPGGGAC